MRVVEIVGEAVRNLRSGASRAGALVLTLIVVSTGLLVADSVAIGALQERAKVVRSQGGAVRVLVAEAAVNARVCSNLDELETIADSGAIWPLGSIGLLALPGVSIPLFQIAPGVAHMLDFPDIKSGGAYIPETLSRRWRAQEGSRLETSAGTIEVMGVYRYSETDGRDPRLANAVVTVGEMHKAASECWYSVWPPSEDSDHYVYGSVIANASGESAPQIAPLNPLIGQRFDFASEYSTRVTALAAPAVVVLFGSIACLGVSRRRMELASNLHSGGSRREILSVMGTEIAIWAFLAAGSTFILVRLAGKLLLRDTLAGYETALLSTLALAVAAAVMGGIIPALLTREDRLFAIFKSRT